MSSLNLSTNGPSINKSYRSIVDAPPPTGPAASSPTYATWAIFSVSAPLANVFAQTNSSQESVLKVQSTGEGELVDLIDEFSDGKIQFAFVKVKDPNTTLHKSVLIAWCGEGVPERTKGYFTSHLAAVSRTLHGYHVQVTARSDRDLTPATIIQKVSDASGSKYSGTPSSSAVPPPPVASKPVFTPTQSNAGSSGFNPLAERARQPVPTSRVDEDGWGEDAPPVTRTQLEKVQSSYQPTKLGLHGLASQSSGASAPSPGVRESAVQDDRAVKGAYQPVGKVDIAEIRRQAQKDSRDDRPTPVKGAYEPIGKVDIAAIRARAQQPATNNINDTSNDSPPSFGRVLQESSSHEAQPSGASERLTSLPKPKIANRFGPSTTGFTGTKPPAPTIVGQSSSITSVPVKAGVGRTFADQGGKTPAQIWAEKKGRSDSRTASETSRAAPIAKQTSGGVGGEWKSGYSGKSWTPVQTARTGQSSESTNEHQTDSAFAQHVEDSDPLGGDVNAIKNRFKTATRLDDGNDSGPPKPPVLDISNKPNAGRGTLGAGLASVSSQDARKHDEPANLPTPPPQPSRSPTPPTPPAVSGSPIRVAMPVGRHQQPAAVTDAREQLASPPPMPTRSIADAVPRQEDLADETAAHHAARGAAEATAISSFPSTAVGINKPDVSNSSIQAIVEYDYEKAEDNELELREGETISNIEIVDPDWWMGENEKGETGLFPSNYVVRVEAHAEPQTGHLDDGPSAHDADPVNPTSPAATEGRSATALYDYEAAEDNELSFPEDAKITDVEFPDENWWSGSYRGHVGLFPASYVSLDE